MNSEQALARLRAAVFYVMEFSRAPYLKDFYLGNITEIRMAADAIEPYLTGESRDAFQAALTELLDINPQELPNEEGDMCETDEELGDCHQQDKIFSCLEKMFETAVPVILQPAPSAAPLVHNLKLHLAQLQALQPHDPRTLKFYGDSLADIQATVNALQSHLAEMSWFELQECWRDYSRFNPEKFEDRLQVVGQPVYAEDLLQLMTEDMIRAAQGELVYACCPA